MDTYLDSAQAPRPLGSVSLVGAGPGDPELLTVRALRRLTAADVVLHDNLVPSAILELANQARLIDVGKIGGGRATSQAVIHRLMLKEARSGLRVVRLKGGDPFVFGRGGEEAIFLRRHGVSVEVVPGVTSAIAAASAGGIPVTHRGVSTHFTVVTCVGATGDGAPLESTWRAAASSGGTVVFMMGLSRLENIVAAVRESGVPDDRPMAVVGAATTPDQVVVAGTVGTIVELTREANVASPATIVLGDVVGLRAAIVGEVSAVATPQASAALAG